MPEFRRQERTYLSVPFAQKDEARTLGARFDGPSKRWFVPPGADLRPFRRWWPAPLGHELSEVAPGPGPGSAAGVAVQAADHWGGRLLGYWQQALLVGDLDLLLKNQPGQFVRAPSDVGGNRLRFSAGDPLLKAADGPGAGREDGGVAVEALVGFLRPTKETIAGTVLMAVPALLGADGRLGVPPAGQPRLNPRLLTPYGDGPFDIGDEAEHERFHREHPRPAATSWAEWWQYGEKLFEAVCGRPLSGYAHPEQGRGTLAAAIVVQTTDNDFSRHLHGLYRQLRDQTESELKTRVPLLVRLCAGRTASRPPVPPGRLRAAHVAHMDQRDAESARQGRPGAREGYSLDTDQRRAVGHALALADGEVLAVNGPPGTGKTATMRGLIASLWVNAALSGDDDLGAVPPLVVATAATNKAVTNLIGSFGAIADVADSPDAPMTLARRWLDVGLSSYGWYAANPRKATEPDFQSFQILHRPERDDPDNLSGFPWKVTVGIRSVSLDPQAERGEMTRAYLAALRAVFADAADSVTTPEAAARFLRARLRVAARDAPERLRQRLHPLLRELSALPAGLRGRPPGVLPEAGQGPQVATGLWARLRRAAPRAWRWWRRRGAERARLDLEKVLTAAEADTGRGAEALRSLLDGPLGEADFAARAEERLEEWLDLSLRTRAFHLAARYWEARWLCRSSKPLWNKVAALRQCAMLAPCVVATCHSLPKVFTGKRDGPTVLAEADLLIFDEAGQAAPEIAVPAFALARRAVVIGDLEQLAPISAHTASADTALRARHGLLEAAPRLTCDGQRVSGGSAMAMARAASAYDAAADQPGLTLTCHYRCRPEIIGFCNALIYERRGSKLRPVSRGPHPINQFLPTLGYVKVREMPNREGGSWTNEKEAAEIVRWLQEKRPLIEAAYAEAKPHRPPTLSSLVAVLTPFKQHARLLEAKLKEAGLLGEGKGKVPMVVGTIHALQGAERPIVIFSPATGPDDGGSGFMDARHDMLNVAVSRAQESFLLFGHPDLFFSPEKTRADEAAPSAVLGRHLRVHGRLLYPLHVAVVESPTKAKLLNEWLPREFFAVASAGHFRDLDESESARPRPENGFCPRWVTAEAKTGFLNEIAFRLDGAERLLLATDDDREGEAIAWHVLDALRKRGVSLAGKRVERMRFHALEAGEIERATRETDALNMNLVRAALTRRVGDYVIGRELSRIVRASLRDQGQDSDGGGLGRVQAALLLLLRQRPAQRWLARARWQREGGEALVTTILERNGRAVEFPSEQAARAAAPSRLLAQPTHLVRRLATPGFVPPLTTAEVYVQALQRLGMLPEEAGKLLQGLYEGDLS